MPRRNFGGTALDLIYTKGANGVILVNTLTELTAWDAPGGTQHTDLLIGATPMSSIMTDDAGKVPRFQGPLDVEKMYLFNGIDYFEVFCWFTPSEAGGGGAGTITSVNGDPGPVIVLDMDDLAETATWKKLAAAERTKLAGITAGATANSSDAQLRDRATHTGAQPISSVTDLQTELDTLDDAITAGLGGKVDTGIGGAMATTLIVIHKDPTTGFWPVSWTGLVPTYTGGSASAGVRPTARGDICCMWKGPDPSPAVVTTGTGGMRDMTGGAIGDIRFVHP